MPSAIAMDIRPGPLSRARENVAACGLEGKIALRLSDGMEGLAPGEGDTLVIAGMGGPLMERILTEGKEQRESFSEMILSPQSDVIHFRRFLREIRWEIREEQMVEEDGKFYILLKAGRDEKALNEKEPEDKGREEPWASCPTPEEWFGRELLNRRDPVLLRYLQKEERIRLEILSALEAAAGKSALAGARMSQVETELQVIRAALGRYEDRDTDPVS